MKGQVTIFVVIGIVLLLAVGIFIFVISKSKTAPPTLPEVPNEFQAVSQVMEQCTNQLAEQAVRSIGEHGGYLDPFDRAYARRDFLYDPADPTASELLPLSQDYAIPYWFHLEPPNVCRYCVVTSDAPTLEEMERQIRLYVEENMADCLDFSQLQDFTIEEGNDSIATASITESDVTVLYNHTLFIKKSDGKQYTLNAVFTTVNIPLKETYAIAAGLTQGEIEGQFIENLILYELNTYGGLQSNQLPPMTAQMTQGYYFVLWSQTRSKLRMKELLSRDIPALQVRSSANSKPVLALSSAEQGFYTAAALDFFPNISIERTSIDFIYMNWNPYMVIQPNRGDIIYPSQYEDNPPLYLPPSRFSTYQYFYDISVPVAVEITRAIPGKEPFTFVFALEGNIRENKRIMEWLLGYGTIPWENDFVSIGQNVTDPGTNRTYATLPSPRLLCENRLSSLTTVRTYDARTRTPLDNVSVTFGCGDFGSCPIGRTTLRDGRALLAAKLPLCMNGYVLLSKDGYRPTVLPLTTRETEEVSTSGFLERIIQKNVSIRVIPLNWTGSSFSASPQRSLLQGETVILNIIKNVSGLEEEQANSLIFEGDEEKTADFITGKYTVEGLLFSTKEVIIPKNCAQQCIREYPVVGGCAEHAFYPPDDLNLTGMPVGGISYTWRIYNDDLDGQNKLIVYILALPDPPCVAQLEWQNNLGQYARDFMALPRFSQ
ncbi:MAG: hypothetical protein V1725_02765 [archaeon]